MSGTPSFVEVVSQLLLVEIASVDDLRLSAESGSRAVAGSVAGRGGRAA